MRGQRITYPGAVFHVINRFVDRHPFFENNSDFEMFLKIYFEAAIKYNIKTYAYCLMNNHFHLIIEDTDGVLSKFLCYFLSRVAKKMNKSKNRKGHLFQGRSKTLLIESEKYFEIALGYVLLNSVRAGISETIFDYKWNSVNETLKFPLNLIDREGLNKLLFNQIKIDKFNKLFVKWIKAINNEKIDAEFKAKHKGSFLSDKEFRETILSKVERRKKITIKKGNRKNDLINKNIIQCLKRDILKIIKEKNINIKLWKSKVKAMQQIVWYYLHDIRYFSWKSIQQIEYEQNNKVNITQMSNAVIRINKHKEKQEIVDIVISQLKD
jgi:putative transposase